jgi:hypothetical protein
MELTAGLDALDDLVDDWATATKRFTTRLRGLLDEGAAESASAAEAGRSRTKWVEVKRLQDQTYSWPPDHGGFEKYDPFVIYQSKGSRLALAYNVNPVFVKGRARKQVWVFRLGTGGGSKEPIVPFVAADDYEDTRELVAIIRGKGETGRQMFGPGDELPPTYAHSRIDNLGERIDGHYNRYCVVAHEDDLQTMLDHGAAQVELRGW